MKDTLNFVDMSKGDLESAYKKLFADYESIQDSYRILSELHEKICESNQKYERENFELKDTNKRLLNIVENLSGKLGRN